MIGDGVYSRVYQAVTVSTSCSVALKVFRDTKSYAKCARTEASILRELGRNTSDSYIVQFYGLCALGKHVTIVLELGTGDLYHHQKNVLDGLTPSEQLFPLTKLTTDVLSGLVTLDSHSIVHRDMKPENILLVNRGGVAAAVISDFGSATRRRQSWAVDGYVMSPWYRSPEIYADGLSCAAGDMWSFGCIVFEYAFGVPLFPVTRSRYSLPKEQTMLYRAHEHFMGESPSDYLHHTSPLPPHDVTDDQLKPRHLEDLDRTSTLLAGSPVIAELLQMIFLWDPAERITPVDALAIARTWDQHEPVPLAALSRPRR